MAPSSRSSARIHATSTHAHPERSRAERPKQTSPRGRPCVCMHSTTTMRRTNCVYAAAAAALALSTTPAAATAPLAAVVSVDAASYATLGTALLTWGAPTAPNETLLASVSPFAWTENAIGQLDPSTLLLRPWRHFAFASPHLRSQKRRPTSDCLTFAPARPCRLDYSSASVPGRAGGAGRVGRRVRDFLCGSRSRQCDGRWLAQHSDVGGGEFEVTERLRERGAGGVRVRDRRGGCALAAARVPPARLCDRR